jgi:hypothetical protein
MSKTRTATNDNAESKSECQNNQGLQEVGDIILAQKKKKETKRDQFIGVPGFTSKVSPDSLPPLQETIVTASKASGASDKSSDSSSFSNVLDDTRAVFLAELEQALRQKYDGKHGASAFSKHLTVRLMRKRMSLLRKHKK